MKSRLFTILIAVLVTVSAFAEKPIRRTVVIKDGKVISDGAQVLDLGDLGGKRAYLGVSMIDLSPDLREHFGASRDAGVLVESVSDGSPAEKAGVHVGDIIVAIDGKDVKNTGDLRSAIREKKDGDTVRVEVLRGRGRTALVATLVEREGPRIFTGDLEELTSRLGSGEWRARVQSLGGDCDELQGRIKELETRLKELEKKLQK
jgi:membrane-associated protease RseP (regulator of RpoE activity)